MMSSLKIPYEDDTTSDDDENDNDDDGESKQLMESILSKLAQQKENAKLRKRKSTGQRRRTVDRRRYETCAQYLRHVPVLSANTNCYTQLKILTKHKNK